MEIRIPNKPENMRKACVIASLSKDVELEVVAQNEWIIIRESENTGLPNVVLCGK